MRLYLDGSASTHHMILRMMPYWLRMGHSLSNIHTGCDVQLSNVRMASNSGRPIIYRLDGIYYDMATDYTVRNMPMKKAHQLSDGVIYQSKFSSVMCQKYLGPRKSWAKAIIIHNGIEPGWCGTHIDSSHFIIVLSSAWRRHKRLKEMVELYLEFTRTHPDSFLRIFGRLEDNIPVKHPNITYYGEVPFVGMVKTFQEANLLLHMSKKDACPNTVVEALGAGIPVITTSSCGGATEMTQMTPGCIVCGNDGDPFDMEPCYPYTDEYNVLTKELKEEILDAMDLIYKDRRRVTLHPTLHIKYVAERYIDLMKALI